MMTGIPAHSSAHDRTSTSRRWLQMDMDMKQETNRRRLAVDCKDTRIQKECKTRSPAKEPNDIHGFEHRVCVCLDGKRHTFAPYGGRFFMATPSTATLSFSPHGRGLRHNLGRRVAKHSRKHTHTNTPTTNQCQNNRTTLNA